MTSKFLSILGILEATCDKHWSNYLSQTISGVLMIKELPVTNNLRGVNDLGMIDVC